MRFAIQNQLIRRKIHIFFIKVFKENKLENSLKYAISLAFLVIIWSPYNIPDQCLLITNKNPEKHWKY